MEIYEANQHTQIFKKGDIATLFFVIKQGDVEIIKDSTTDDSVSQKILLTNGDFFGDLALLYTAKRSASAKSLSKCIFICLSNYVFRNTIQQIARKNFELSKAFIQKAPVFNYLTKRQKNAVAYNTLLLRFQKGQQIFCENDDANCFYIVTSGRIQIKISGKCSLQMKQGDSFGQNSFFEFQKRSGTAVALQLSSLLSISRQSLKKCLGNQLQQISFYNILKWSFSRSQLFSSATNSERQRLISLTQLKQYDNQQIISMQGEKASHIVINLQGSINGQKVGHIFNTEYIFYETQNDRKMVSRLLKNDRGFIAMIKFDHIFAILGPNFNKPSTSHSSKDTHLKRLQYITKLQLNDFTIISKISENFYSKTYCVMDNLKRFYTIKCISKCLVLQKNMAQFVLKQKQIISILDNVFLPKLYKIVQDESFVYFLTNYIEGANFLDVLIQIGHCNKKKAQFFLACLIVILQYMHENNIIYRDLKPQNILVQESGYLNIIDFGIAKILTEQTGFRTFTVVGTPHYMAPQTVQVQGYSFSADLWSLGVIFYQIVCGILPFGNTLTDPYQIFKQIDLKDVQIPFTYDDSAGKDIIMTLLSRNPSDRLCQQFGKLKNMEYFQNFDWESLQKKKMQAPFKIKPKNNHRHLNQPLVKAIRRDKSNIQNGYEKQSNIIWRQF